MKMIARALVLSACAGLGWCGLGYGLGGVTQVGTATRPAAPTTAEASPQAAGARRGRPAQLGVPGQIAVTPDGKEVLYVKVGSAAVGQAVYAFDVSTGQERALLTSASFAGVAAASEPSTRASREQEPPGGRGRNGARGGFGGQGGLPGVSRFAMSLDGTTLLATASGRQFVVDRATLKPRALPADFRASATLSANGRTMAFLRDGEVWSLDLRTMAERQLSSGAGGSITDGQAEFIAREEFDRFDGFWLAADGEHVAFQRTDTAGMEMLTAEDVTHQEAPPHVDPYPRPGKQNARLQLFVASTSGSGQPVECVWDHEKYPYIGHASWSEPGAPLTVVVFNRVQTEMVVLGFSEKGGEGKVLARETDPAWVNLAPPVWMPGGKKFFLRTERNGQEQLELHDVESGKATLLTTPEFGYRSVIGCEGETAAFVTTGGVGVAAKAYRIPLEPGKFEREVMMESVGQYGMNLGRSGTTWVKADVDGEKTTWAVYASGKGKVGELGSVAVPALRGSPNVEIGWVDAVDPKLAGIKYRYALIRPRQFDPKKKYPVIVSVYAGPHENVVRESKQSYVRDQATADRGAIVMMMDGRGTPNRGREWERAIKGNLIDIALTDQVAGLKALCARYPEMDEKRVGIHGWSFGGYFSAMAAMRRPDVYKVAVAGAPVAAWEDYDTAYTERYMDLPESNPAGYKAASVLTYCKDLEVPLLIIHGTADDNVYFMHSMKIVRALIDANRDFDFLPMPGSHHGPGDPATSVRVNQKTMDYLFSHLSEE